MRGVHKSEPLLAPGKTLQGVGAIRSGGNDVGPSVDDNSHGAFPVVSGEIRVVSAIRVDGDVNSRSRGPPLVGIAQKFDPAC